MKKLVFALALLCVAAGTLQAQNVYQWFGGEPANSDWNYGMNWKEEFTNTFGTVPDIYAKIKVNNVKWGSIAEPLVGGSNGVQNITIGDIFIAEAGAALSPESVHVGVGGTLNVMGSNDALPTEGQVNIGYQAGAVGGLTVDGGTMTVKGPLHVGWGGTGTVDITADGLLTVGALDIGGAGGNGHIDVQGTLVVKNANAAVLAALQLMIDNGQLTSGGLAENVSIAQVGRDAYITPEPVSIALMGLGALLLRKRS